MRFRRRRGLVESPITDVEVLVLSTAVRDLLELLGSDGESESDELAQLVGLSSSTSLPDDPALARLFPDAYRPDASSALDPAAAAAEFRRYTEADLRSGKRNHAQAVLETLAGVGHSGLLRLDRGQVDAWLACLTDLRLVLGTRLEVTDDGPHEPLPADDPRAHAMEVFAWLGWVQESLLQCIDPHG